MSERLTPARLLAEDKASINRLTSQVSALREAIRDWGTAHEAARACPEMILSSGKTDKAAALMRAVDAADAALRRLLADTEAAARGHDQRLRLEGARELVKRAIEQHFNLTDEYAYAQAPDFWMDRLREALAVQEKLADMEAEHASR